MTNNELLIPSTAGTNRRNRHAIIIQLSSVAESIHDGVITDNVKSAVLDILDKAYSPHNEPWNIKVSEAIVRVVEHGDTDIVWAILQSTIYLNYANN